MAAPPAFSAALVRVPRVTAAFWALKLLTTGMGETSSDFLVKNTVPEIAVGVASLLLVAVLVLQFRMRRYVPRVYWGTALMVSVVGTMVADIAHVALGVPYAVSTVVFVVALAAVLTLWWRSERTLDVHHITTARRESFYWATVIITFALGTAAGDLTATVLGLGYFGSIWLFGALILVPAAAFRWVRMPAVAAFWTAYVLTRPLGASVADWLAVPQARGGLDFGTGLVSLVALGVFVVAVALLSRRPSGALAAEPA